MSQFYDEAATTVVEMLDEFGQVVRLNRADTGAYNPDTGTVEPGTTLTFLGLGVVLSYRQEQIDGTLIRQGDRRMYVAANLATTPRPGDSIILADDTLVSVVISSPFAPDGTLVYHDVQCRSES